MRLTAREQIGLSVVQTVLVYLLTILGIVASMLISLVVPGADKASSVIGRSLDPPFWSLEICLGVIAGCGLGRRLSIRLVWAGAFVPSLLLILDIAIEGLKMRAYTPLLDIYFSSNSGATEGLYKLFFVAPLYTAVAYALGAGGSKLTKHWGQKFPTEQEAHCHE